MDSNIDSCLYNMPSGRATRVTVPFLVVAAMHGFAQFSFTSHFLSSEIEDVNSQALTIQLQMEMHGIFKEIKLHSIGC